MASERDIFGLGIVAGAVWATGGDAPAYVVSATATDTGTHWVWGCYLCSFTLQLAEERFDTDAVFRVKDARFTRHLRERHNLRQYG